MVYHKTRNVLNTFPNYQTTHQFVHQWSQVSADAVFVDWYPHTTRKMTGSNPFGTHSHPFTTRRVLISFTHSPIKWPFIIIQRLWWQIIAQMIVMWCHGNRWKLNHHQHYLLYLSNRLRIILQFHPLIEAQCPWWIIPLSIPLHWAVSCLIPLTSSESWLNFLFKLPEVMYSDPRWEQEAAWGS